MRSGIDSLFRYLPARISRLVSSLPPALLRDLTEVRLRTDAPLSLTVKGKNLFIDPEGRPCKAKNSVRTGKAELEECIALLTRGSLYTYDDTIKQGYIPIEGGGRAGISGDAVVKEGKVSGFKQIRSVNLRIQRHIPGFASPLIRFFAEEGLCGTLIYAPPAAGKTTFLRSAAYLLAEGTGIRAHRVGIADERGELFILGCPARSPTLFPAAQRHTRSSFYAARCPRRLLSATRSARGSRTR